MNKIQLEEAIQRFKDAKVLVIGDIIVDHFIWGKVSRISPEAPVPVVNVSREEMLLGGAANVLKNIFSLGGRGELCGIIGRDELGTRLVDMVEELSINSNGIVHGRRPTTVKTRIVAQGQQVVRFDREQVGIPSKGPLGGMIEFLDEHLSGFDAIIVSDYAKGVVNEQFMTHLHQCRKNLFEKSGRKIPLVVDPKPSNLHHYVGATVITPNHLEAKNISGMELQEEPSIHAAARFIRDEIGCENVLITRGEAGMTLLRDDNTLTTIPAMAKEVYDVTGAGDTVVATLALGLAVGCSVEHAAMLANHAAGIVVGKIGTASVNMAELSDCLK
ncbi:MAG: D-glycero-beta-D-manno-heptose-7-phosphate kinase [Desulfobulbaceae bacterium]|nr:D-glycero-beta-D-manno-heptose-7-phosphate kinase [Desulfobulbaceae bacterium]